MEYLEYTFSGFKDENAKDILIALLDNAGYSGFLESGDRLQAYISEEERNERLLNSILGDMQSHTGELDLSSVTIPETNWNAKWESEFKPVKLGEEVYIRASFHPALKGFNYEIIIEPKMSFGTGHHETTQLMVQSMIGIDFTAKKVLDMGCGTGVLGILASKMACETVLGIDIDDWACRNSTENAWINKCNNITVVQGDVSAIAQQKFHTILANINRNVLLRDMTVYSDALLLKGILIVSGILEQDEKDILDEGTRCGLKCQYSRKENKWLSIIFKKEALN